MSLEFLRCILLTQCCLKTYLFEKSQQESKKYGGGHGEAEVHELNFLSIFVHMKKFSKKE
ncbi:MAG: hypothetical protein BV458_07755 [Thermoplasmata archaeon M9B2D]|nr:MAG: hypothetical protein BV458_07755 [Thermoplasmata archaeon M9B2D]